MDGNNQLAKIEQDTKNIEQKLSDATAKTHRGAEIGQTYTNRLAVLQDREAGLSPDRDAYLWIINVVNPFIQTRRGINIYSFSQPDFTETGMFPKFPYTWATFHLKGVGFYQDIGKFFADFENTFPYYRIQNVDLTANPGPGYEPEKLSFTFDIVTPVVSSSEVK